MKRKTVKKIFWFFILFLPLQYAAVGIVGVIKSEPWPAFVLPAFKSVYDDKDGVILTDPQLYLTGKDNRKAAKIELATLFNRIKKSQRLKFLQMHYSNHKGLNRTSKKWLKKQVLQAYPGEEGNRIKITWPAIRFKYFNGAVKVDTLDKGNPFFIKTSYEQ